MAIKANEEFGAYDIICDRCHSVFSSEEGETPLSIEDDLKFCKWRVEDGKHICFRCVAEETEE